jgi:hypothetical protein
MLGYGTRKLNEADPLTLAGGSRHNVCYDTQRVLLFQEEGRVLMSRMVRTIVGMAAVVLILTAMAVPARAQGRPQPSSPVIPYQSPAWLTLGGWIGLPLLGPNTAEAWDVSAHTGVDFLGSIEVPVAHTWLVRGEVGRSRWTANASQPSEVVLRRFTLGVVHNLHPFSPFRAHPYLTGGVGIYRVAIGSTELSSKSGLHGGAGLEFPVGDSPIVINGELQIHTYASTGDFVNLGTAAIGFKVRF